MVSVKSFIVNGYQERRTRHLARLEHLLMAEPTHDREIVMSTAEDEKYSQYRSLYKRVSECLETIGCEFNKDYVERKMMLFSFFAKIIDDQLDQRRANAQKYLEQFRGDIKPNVESQEPEDVLARLLLKYTHPSSMQLMAGHLERFRDTTILAHDNNMDRYLQLRIMEGKACGQATYHLLEEDIQTKKREARDLLIQLVILGNLFDSASDLQEDYREGALKNPPTAKDVLMLGKTISYESAKLIAKHPLMTIQFGKSLYRNLIHVI